MTSAVLTDAPDISRKPDDSRTPGGIAVWILIYAELTEFALFFLVYLIARAHNPEIFSAGPGALNTTAGLANTLLLITSSFCMARAVATVRRNDRQRTSRWLWLTIACALGYCGVKGWEYLWNDAHDIYTRRDIFFTLYYYLTFNHLLHVLMGIVIMLWMLFRNRLGSYDEEHEGFENGACYWHMIDLVWIIIFPLLYVLG